MENTLENKARFFAQYLNQKVLLLSETDKGTLLTFLFLDEQDLKRYKLNLTPLSQISDEDARYCGLRLGIWGKHEWGELSDEVDDVLIKYGKMFGDSLGKYYGMGLSCPFARGLDDILECLDYLRSKGYALPFMGLSVEKQIQYGWVKLKEDNG